MPALDLSDRPTLAAAADTNFVVHAGWAAAQLRGMQVRAHPDLVLIDSGLPCDTFNVVCRARLGADTAPARIREAIDHFDRAGRPFSWWVGPGDRPPDLGAMLAASGLERAESELAMAADLVGTRLDDGDPPGLEVRRVRTVTELRDYTRINAANWNPPDPCVVRFYERATSVLLTPDSPQWLYVGYIDGDAVATAELTVGGGVVGLYNISTLEGYRRRGFGTALTLQPLRDALAQGHRTCVLQAASAGVGVYRRVGFQPFGDITEYKPTEDHEHALARRLRA